MRKSIILCSVATAMFASLTLSAAEKVALYPLEKISVDDTTAEAIERSLMDEIQSRGYVVVVGEDEVAPPAVTDTAAVESAPPQGDPKAADKKDDGAAETGTVVTAPPEAVLTRSDQSRELGCTYYITGSIVRLGNQTTVALELNHVDSGTVSAKKVIARTDAELPRAVQTIAGHMAQDMSRHSASIPASAAPAPAAATGDGETPPPSAPPASDLKFEKNFGLSIMQGFSLKDEMYSFTSFNFNGRFEFNQLLLMINAGFAMGNKQFDEGFHFGLDVGLAAYLTKTQVAPYVGGGIGLFLGNKLDTCTDYDDRDYYYYDECDEDTIVGWQVFPVVGVEILRTFPLRLHVEARYLIAFNAFLDWGHGPMLVLGVAF